MSNGDNLEVPRFQLEAISTLADVRVKLMKAYADFNYRMMEVLLKKVEVARSFLEFQILSDAFRNYQQARIELLRERRLTINRIRLINKNVQNVKYISQGETLDPGLVSFAWVGIRFFINNAPLEASFQINALPVESFHLQGTFYSLNRDPEAATDDIPTDITNIRALIDFLARKSYMPRIASPPYDLFAELAAVLKGHADEDIAELEIKLIETNEELEELRRASYETIGIGEPKEVEDA